MTKDYGKKMAELHLQYKSCKPPCLNDDECWELRGWLKEMYEYNYKMGHGINAVHFASEYESMDRVCEARMNQRQKEFKERYQRETPN